jgi:hypothetical protein
MISVLGTHQHADESLRKIRITAMIGRQCCDRPTVGCGAVRMRLFFLVRTAGIVLGETIDGSTSRNIWPAPFRLFLMRRPIFQEPDWKKKKRRNVELKSTLRKAS